MSKRKSGWGRAQELERKKRKEDDKLKKTHPLTSFFSVVVTDEDSDGRNDNVEANNASSTPQAGCSSSTANNASSTPQAGCSSSTDNNASASITQATS